MTPNAITLLFTEARDTFPPIKGKPTDNDLQSICKKLLPILMEIPYDQLGGTHSLMGILTDATRYAANHGGATFVRPLHLPLYDATIADNATTVVRVPRESAHQAKLNDCASFEAAKHGAAQFLCEVVDEVWYNNLKDANTFYTKVTAREIIAFLDANSRGLHTINMISLRTNMHNYYTQVNGIPQYINMLEDAQKKATRAGMPITDVEIVMMASAAVLAAQHFPRKVDNWKGLLSASCTWTAWKTAFRLAHVKRQQQILASREGEPLGRAHGVILAAAPAIGRLKTVLNNLALVATNNTVVLQQLIAANLALTATIMLLTATNKKLVDAATRWGGTPAATPGWGGTQAATQATTPAATPAGIRATRKPFPGNYCWTHGHRVSKHHMSATCANKAPGHPDDATASNTFGGSNKDKNWIAVCT
jgi:hypothetical protein